MAWKLQRHLPAWHPASGHAGPHMMGDVAVDFDTDGVAIVDDPNVVELARQFPETFQVEEAMPAEDTATTTEGEAATATPRGTAIPPAGYTAAELDAETIVDLRELATSMDIHSASRYNKADLIAEILAKQEQDASA